MSHFIELDESNMVVRGIVINNEELIINGVENEAKGISFAIFHCGGTYWKQTSYNAATNGFRKNYAGIGYSYDEVRDAFIAPKGFDSWVLDEATCQWIAPVPYPSDGKDYRWNEELGDWVAIGN